MAPGENRLEGMAPQEPLSFPTERDLPETQTWIPREAQALAKPTSPWNSADGRQHLLPKMDGPKR